MNTILWETRVAVAFVGRIRLTIIFKPKKLNGHAASHPWVLSIDGMKYLKKRAPKVAGSYRCSGFQTEREARQYATTWLRDRGHFDRPQKNLPDPHRAPARSVTQKLRKGAS